MVSLGISTGLLMTWIFGSIVWKNIKEKMVLKITEEQKETQFQITKEQMEEKMGKGFMPSVKTSMYITFALLMLLLIVSVLSQFQSYLHISLAVISLLLMTQSALKAWDERKKEMSYEKTTAFIYVRNMMIFLICVFFTTELIWSLFA